VSVFLPTLLSSLKTVIFIMTKRIKFGNERYSVIENDYF
jgi:hypothetical protein